MGCKGVLEGLALRVVFICSGPEKKVKSVEKVKSLAQFLGFLVRPLSHTLIRKLCNSVSCFPFSFFFPLLSFLVVRDRPVGGGEEREERRKGKGKTEDDEDKRVKMDKKGRQTRRKPKTKRKKESLVFSSGVLAILPGGACRLA